MLRSDFNIRKGVAFGPIGAVASAVAPVASVFGMAKSAFGKDKGTPYSAGSSNSVQGYAAMPKYLQDIYEKEYAPAAINYFNSSEGMTPNPIAPFNQMQQNAIKGLGQNINEIQASLQDYMNPYNQYVTDQIKRNYGMEQNNLLGNAQKMGGLGALKSSSLGAQLSLNNEAMQRALAEAQYNAYREALGLRKETLADIFESGMLQQQQQQTEMSAQAQNPFSRVKNLGELLALIPGSTIQSSVGSTPVIAPAPNKFQRGGAFLNELANMTKGGIFNNMFGK